MGLMRPRGVQTMTMTQKMRSDNDKELRSGNDEELRSDICHGYKEADADVM